ncbi:MAG: hypothetical protein ACFNUO_09780 [Capnocytophaga ochracea]
MLTYRNGYSFKIAILYVQGIVSGSMASLEQDRTMTANRYIR